MQAVGHAQGAYVITPMCRSGKYEDGGVKQGWGLQGRGMPAGAVGYRDGELPHQQAQRLGVRRWMPLRCKII